MPLATPSNITLTRLYRVWKEPVTVRGSDGLAVTERTGFDVFGNVNWTNTEAGAHSVVVTFGSSVIYYPRAATSAPASFLVTYNAPDVATKSLAIKVKLISSTEESSEASTTFTIDGVANAAFTSNMAVSGNDITLPTWSGVLSQDPLLPADPRLGTMNQFLAQTLAAQRLVRGGETISSLPAALLQGEVYRAELNVSSGAVVAATTPLRLNNLTGIGNSLISAFRHYSGGLTALRQTLFFTAPAPVAVFAAESLTARAVRNSPIKLELKATHRATWAITSGNPGGLGIEYDPPTFGTAGPDRAFLSGTPTTSGGFTVNLTATRSGTSTTSTSTATLTVLDSLPRTTVSTNAAIAKDGLTLSTGDQVNIAFQSVPSPATWIATGLPAGVSIDNSGNVAGSPTRAGVYFASITARATDFDVSVPTTIRFDVKAGTTAVDSNAAARRSPWLLTQWELTDLHILARSRQVESTMFEGGALRLKLGDAVNFAVFFVDQNGDVFAMAPTQLRLTIRKADNLDDLIILKSSTPPTAVTTEGQTYYSMPVVTGNREREVALEWAEDNGENKPLACVADLDWIKDSKLYSSRSFPVSLELDVTRP
jgi:hypothetical protein